ncbi:MAG TPA: hypothetical protein VJ205_02460, partial [Gammaproteobacteria bacterium]|nr:hypothetical protein [Gammaproteobacteria bacterium]
YKMHAKHENIADQIDSLKGTGKAIKLEKAKKEFEGFLLVSAAVKSEFLITPGADDHAIKKVYQDYNAQLEKVKADIKAEELKKRAQASDTSRAPKGHARSFIPEHRTSEGNKPPSITSSSKKTSDPSGLDKEGTGKTRTQKSRG